MTNFLENAFVVLFAEYVLVNTSPSFQQAAEDFLVKFHELNFENMTGTDLLYNFYKL